MTPDQIERYAALGLALTALALLSVGMIGLVRSDGSCSESARSMGLAIMALIIAAVLV